MRKYWFSVSKIGGKTSKVLLSFKTVFQHFYRYSDWFWYQSSLFGPISHSHDKSTKFSRIDTVLCIYKHFANYYSLRRKVHTTWANLSSTDLFNQDKNVEKGIKVHYPWRGEKGMSTLNYANFGLNMTFNLRHRWFCPFFTFLFQGDETQGFHNVKV